MSPEEINKKAYERYPVKMVPDDETMGFTSTDVNEVARMGYIEAYKEISALPTIKGWASRDEDGTLELYDSIPQRTEELGFWNNETSLYCTALPKDMLPSLHWDDDPIEVELPIIRK